MLPTSSSAGREPVEITAMQRMLSATSGSLLTSLLGMPDAAFPGLLTMKLLLTWV